MHRRMFMHMEIAYGLDAKITLVMKKNCFVFLFVTDATFLMSRPSPNKEAMPITI